jgi:maltose-binding protein MalE
MPPRQHLAVLVVLICLLPAGCRLAPEPDPTVELTWWVTYARDTDEYDAFQAIADAYTERTENVVVELVAVPWDDMAPRGAGASRLALAQQSGTGPDLWGPLPHNWTGAFAQTEQVLALEAAQIEDLRQYVDVALHACQFDGVQYGVPILMDSLALIYNRALVPQPPDSFAALVDVAKELTDAEEDRWGLALPLLSQYHVYPFIDGYGGYIFNCDDQSCDVQDIGLNNEGAVRGIQFLSDLYVKEHLFPEPLVDRAVMHSYALRLFTEGRAAMLIEGSWVLPEIRTSEVDYGVTQIPVLPGAAAAPRPLTVVQAMYVSAASAHPEETVALLNYVTGPDSVGPIQGVLGKTPVRQDVLRDQPFRDDREMRAWRDQAMHGVPLPNAPELGYVWIPWGQALDEAIPGLTPTQDVLDRAVEQIQGYMQDEE